MATQTTNYHLTKPAWDEMVDVTVLNDNNDIIDAQMKANETSAANAVANMADAYDATATYQEGDYCTYGGKLYQANTDISVAEAFDATHWDGTTAAEHFSDGGGGGGGTLIQPVVYSDTEREIGVWRDGKSLYQITFHGTFSITTMDRTWYTIKTEQELSALNIETVFIANGTYLIDSSDGTIYLTPEATGKGTAIGALFGISILDNGNLSIVTQSITEGSTQYAITLQYTKTTDTAGSGTWTPSGVPAVHYSTDEQIIGTWIDGSTLYQKTIHIASLPQTSYDTYQIASNIDKVVDYKGIVFYSSGTAVAIFQTRPDNTNSQFYHDIENDKTFFLRTYRSEQGEAYVTFQYTKTTP